MKYLAILLVGGGDRINPKAVTGGGVGRIEYPGSSCRRPWPRTIWPGGRGPPAVPAPRLAQLRLGRALQEPRGGPIARPHPAPPGQCHQQAAERAPARAHERRPSEQHTRIVAARRPDRRRTRPVACDGVGRLSGTSSSLGRSARRKAGQRKEAAPPPPPPFGGSGAGSTAGRGMRALAAMGRHIIRSRSRRPSPSGHHACPGASLSLNFALAGERPRPQRGEAER